MPEGRFVCRHIALQVGYQLTLIALYQNYVFDTVIVTEAVTASPFSFVYVTVVERVEAFAAVAGIAI